MIVAGIDPGSAAGAAAVIDPLTVRTCHSISWDQKNPLDVRFLSNWLHGYDVDVIAIEKAQAMPQQGVSSVFKYGAAYGKLVAMAELLVHDVHLVTPQTWKKHHGLIKAEKMASRDKAVELFPTCREQFERVKDTHRAEAVLIAQYQLERNI